MDIESESSQNVNKWRLDALSIPHCVIKKGRPHGARHGITEAQKECYVAHNVRKRCLEKSFKGIHDRFQKDLRYRDAQLKLVGLRRSVSRWTSWHKKILPIARDSQFKIGWTEEKCIAMDKLAQEDHSYNPSREEYLRYQIHWYPTPNKSGTKAPMRLRSDFQAAVTIMNRLHREPGEERAEPIPFQQYQRWHPSSSSSSWWNWDTSKSWWSS